jgi:hypothetical protein
MPIDSILELCAENLRQIGTGVSKGQGYNRAVKLAIFPLLT